jgi:hypothetical protein
MVFAGLAHRSICRREVVDLQTVVKLLFKALDSRKVRGVGQRGVEIAAANMLSMITPEIAVMLAQVIGVGNRVITGT